MEAPKISLRRQQTLGFSLIEVLLVMALSAVVLSLAMPSYRLISEKTKVSAACAQLERAVSTAREAALHTQGEVVLCGSHDPSGCDGDWSRGQLIAVKNPWKGIVLLASLPEGIQVQWRANLGHNQALVFGPRGLPAGQWGSFWVKGAHESLGCRIRVNALGRITRA